jgi:hypothetical protein
MKHQGHRRTRGGMRRDTKRTGGHRGAMRTGGHSGGSGETPRGPEGTMGGLEQAARPHGSNRASQQAAAVAQSGGRLSRWLLQLQKQEGSTDGRYRRRAAVTGGRYRNWGRIPQNAYNTLRAAFIALCSRDSISIIMAMTTWYHRRYCNAHDRYQYRACIKVPVPYLH